MIRKVFGLRLFAVFVTVLAVFWPGLPGPKQAAHADSPVKVRVEVTDVGFKPATVEVEQGQLVELTFVWAHQAYPGEEHIMVLEGYRLETEKINAGHREATIRFIADRSGTFTFKCDLDCELHQYLQNGVLKVRPGGGGGASRTPTVLRVTPSADTTDGKGVDLTVMLRDPSGGPVAKAEVKFYLETEFVGTKGLMEVGRVKTDDRGLAVWEYRPTVGQPEHRLTVRFEGMGIYDESQQTVIIRQVSTPPAAYVPAPVGFEKAPRLPATLARGAPDWAVSAWSWATNNWGPLTITTLVLGVWAAMARAVYEALRGLSGAETKPSHRR